MRSADEKANTLSRCGSFYYRTLVEKAKSEAEFVSHTSWNTRALAQVQNIANAVTGGSYYNDFFKTIQFTDADINWFGTKAGLQVRTGPFTSWTVHKTTEVVKEIRATGTPDAANIIGFDIGASYRPAVGSVISAIAIYIKNTSEDEVWLSLWRTGSGLTPTMFAKSKKAVKLNTTKVMWDFDPIELTEYHVGTQNGQTARLFLQFNSTEPDSSTGWNGNSSTAKNPSTIRVSTTTSNQITNMDCTLLGNNFSWVNNYSVEVEFLNIITSLENPTNVDVPVNRYDTIEVNDYSAVATAQNDVLTDEASDTILVPIAGSTVVLPATAELRWELTVDENILVTSIKKSDGSIMYMNQDYIAEYGKLTFLENPISLFPSMQFTALSYTVRKPNIFNHMLNLGGVIGPVDRVLTYYRTTQTPKAFYLAACQACGLAVVPATCTVLEAYPLQAGWAYITTAGRIDVPYPHYKLEINTALQKDTVIGGNELFQLIRPEDALPTSVESIELGTAVPIPGLSAPNSDIVIADSAGNVAPAYEGTPEAQQAWRDYITAFASTQPTPGTASSITYRPSGDTTLAEAAAAAAVECDYQNGEAFSLYLTLGDNTAPSALATSNILTLAPDYYLITQAGQYVGLSASPGAMRNAAGQDPGWAPLTSTEDSWGITLNTMSSDSRIYGWISRNAQGNTGTANVLPLNGLIIKITTGYKSNNYGTTITLTPANGSVEEEIICRDASPLNLTQMATNTSVTGNVRISYITVVNSMSEPMMQNGINYFRNVACKGRCIVACINKGVMPKSMQLQLLRFMQRELPVGSVLTTADMPVTISTEETLDV